MTSSANRQVYASSKPVTLTARVTGGDGSPQGTVEWRNGTTVLGTARVVANTAKLTLPAKLVPGTYKIRAVYRSTESTSLGSSSTSPLKVRVLKARAKVSVKVKTKSVRVGNKVALRVKVKAKGVSRPRGKLVIRSNGVKVKTVSLKNAKKGKVNVKFQARTTGNKTIRVRYKGSALVKKKAGKKVIVRVIG